MSDALRRSAISKAEMSRRSGVSRAQIDAYLAGRSQPSVAQLDRLVSAAELRAALVLEDKPREVPHAFLEALELGELFPPTRREPLKDMSETWERARSRE